MKYFFGIIILVIIFSCQNKQVDEIQNTLNHWIGKEILIPKKMVENCKLYNNADYKIVFYVDSVGCFSCKLDFKEWQDFVENFDLIKNKEINFMFVLQTAKTEKLEYLIKWDRFKQLIYFDEYNSFYKLNKLPEKAMFHTFLLDNENKIIAMGDPISNPKIKELYLKIIRGEEVVSRGGVEPVQTKIDIDKSFFSFGTFDWKKEQKVNFFLRNIGDNPFIIGGISTSCRCTTVEYDKEPIKPGMSLILKIKYKADHSEFFDKNIKIYCNVKGSPLQLRITGKAK